jgi:hypothetical protein
VALDDDTAVVLVNEPASETAYLALQRTLAALGVPVA